MVPPVALHFEPCMHAQCPWLLPACCSTNGVVLGGPQGRRACREGGGGTCAGTPERDGTGPRGGDHYCWPAMLASAPSRLPSTLLPGVAAPRRDSRPLGAQLHGRWGRTAHAGQLSLSKCHLSLLFCHQLASCLHAPLALPLQSGCVPCVNVTGAAAAQMVGGMGGGAVGPCHGCWWRGTQPCVQLEATDVRCSWPGTRTLVQPAHNFQLWARLLTPTAQRVDFGTPMPCASRQAQCKGSNMVWIAGLGPPPTTPHHK
jgi:hypothetical protein